ncbi:hypothetical protein BB559_000964 [Furculomyces boomerangus]|uniref:Tetrapyrrole biosynthesis uroporphyrinogen III synthase domain-containing protein n=1 Tax=Furculomyces boomerangus TaxID=61424 RepID=A0A2T9Z3H4_9FUNG|nr:hypothetical protein BB559_000964 [Furculomyces boomerangus]
MNIVILFRSLTIEDPYQKIFEKNKLLPITLPLLSHRSLLSDSLFNQILVQGLFDAITKKLSNPNRTRNEIDAISSLLQLPVFTIGPSTSKKFGEKLNDIVQTTDLKTRNLKTTITEQDNANKLIPEIVLHAKTQQTARYLFLCGNISLDTIPNAMDANGILLTKYTIYTTEKTTPEETLHKLSNSLKSIPKNGECTAWLCFFSPSGVETVHEAMIHQKENVEKVLGVNFVKYAAIGNTTANKCRDLFGIHAIAQQPSPQGLLVAIQNYVEANQSENKKK